MYLEEATQVYRLVVSDDTPEKLHNLIGYFKSSYLLNITDRVYRQPQTPKVYAKKICKAGGEAHVEVSDINWRRLDVS